MAHFAKVENNIVVAVLVGRDEDNETELSERTGHTYIQCSYNTRDGIHYDPETGEPSADQSKALRVNFPSPGWRFYPEIGDDGAFVESPLFASWTLNMTSGLYEPPVAKPDDGLVYEWSELTQEWVEVVEPSA